VEQPRESVSQHLETGRHPAQSAAARWIIDAMTDDWRDPDDIVDDFASGDPARIRTGLLGLIEFNKPGDEFELPPVEAWMLTLVGDPPSDDLVTAFARMLARYASFVPPPSRAHVIRQLVELAVRYGVSQVCFETAIEVKGEADPPAFARDVIGYLRMRGIHGPRELDAAIVLIGYLLDGKPPVRRATTEALAGWAPTETKQAIVSAVRSLADADQRDLLDNPAARAKLPAMNFKDVAVNRQQRYAIGTEQTTGKHYVSFPVSNGTIEYEEYYEIDQAMFDKFRADLDSALPFVERARNRLEDPRLMYQPSTKRGSPT
jgi:hypothetical protein